MVAIMGDPGVLPGLLQLPYATEAAWKKRIEEMPVGPTTAELFIVAERGGEVVGNAGVHPVPHVRRRHTAGIGMAVAQHAQGQGVGSAMMAAIVDWADNWAQLLRLELTVYTDNAAASGAVPQVRFRARGHAPRICAAQRRVRRCALHGTAAPQPAGFTLTQAVVAAGGRRVAYWPHHDEHLRARPRQDGGQLRAAVAGEFCRAQRRSLRRSAGRACTARAATPGRRRASARRGWRRRCARWASAAATRSARCCPTRPRWWKRTTPCRR